MNKSQRILDLLEKKYSTVYHVTPSYKVPIIKSKGLTSQTVPHVVGPTGNDIRNHPNSVYAFTSMKRAVYWAFKLNWKDKLPYSILTIKSDNEFEQDSHWEATEEWVHTDSPIPAGDIVSVTEFTKELIKRYK